MEKAQKAIIGFFVIVILVIAALIIVYNVKLTGNVVETPSNDSIVFYYGSTCPHCKNVEKYFEDNNVSSKIQFQSKEVYENQANAKELLAVAQKCGLDTSSIGVPFLYAGGKCYIGEQEIIDFFQNKLAALS